MGALKEWFSPFPSVSKEQPYSHFRTCALPELCYGTVIIRNAISGSLVRKEESEHGAPIQIVTQSYKRVPRDLPSTDYPDVFLCSLSFSSSTAPPASPSGARKYAILQGEQ
jgi:hypothetical protein